MNARVLIVDDIDCIRRVIRRIVEREGCEVVGEAKDGAEAIEQFHKLNPDLITMDVTMPRCSGIDALRQIVKADPDARVVMCSAMGEEKLVTEALEAGARDLHCQTFPLPACDHRIAVGSLSGSLGPLHSRRSCRVFGNPATLLIPCRHTAPSLDYGLAPRL